MLFKTMLQLCGLPMGQAAEFFGSSLIEIRAWTLGHEEVPQVAWDMLADLYRQIEDCAEEAVAMLTKEGVNPLDHTGGITISPKRDTLPAGASAVAGAMAAARILGRQRGPGGSLEALIAASDDKRAAAGRLQR